MTHLFDNNDQDTVAEREQQPESITSGEQELAHCRQEMAVIKERLMYISAEFDNYRKRTEKERVQWMQQSQAGVLKDVLSVIDDIERAFAQLTPEQRTQAGAWLQGFELIYKACHKLLHTYGVEEMPASGIFDPEKHEAILHVTSEHHTSGDIIAVLQKGYLYKGQILRPAQVSVAQ